MKSAWLLGSIIMSEWLSDIGLKAMETYSEMSNGAIGVVMVIYTLCFIVVLLIFIGYALKSWIYMIKSIFIKKKVKKKLGKK
jgi:cellulose synthase/poly-beta-1,6-N-acetylglucosamine synthase-like glycosyltransferase